jgi:hypothetical protein
MTESTSAYTSSSQDAEEVTLTIYNNHFGAVKEKRRIALTRAHSQITYLDVAALIETESILVKGVDIREMNYEYDLVNKTKLLEKYIGQTVFLRQGANGERSAYRLLSATHGIVLEHEETKEIVLDPADELILPKLPEGLIVRPALVWKIVPSETSSIEVSYLTKGFKWDVNYVMHLQGDRLSLAGWVNIKNKSGATFPNARIKLIAGEVKRVEKKNSDLSMRIYAEGISDSNVNPFEEKEFADYHLYTLSETTTLKNEQNKQVRLFKVDHVPCCTYYEYWTGRGDTNANTMISFDNKEADGMGIPLPKGIVKVYQEDQTDGQLEFIGEDAIDHTPKNETVTLQIGEAFDLVIEHDCVERGRTGKGHEEERHEIIIRNHKSETATVKLWHSIYKRYWRIAKSTHPFEKKDESKLMFEIKVAPGEVAEVRFTLDYDEQRVVYLE